MEDVKEVDMRILDCDPIDTTESLQSVFGRLHACNAAKVE